MSDTSTNGPTQSDSAAPASVPPEPEVALPTFDVLPLSKEVRETLTEMGYMHPTPVQIAVWEPATRGKDAVVQARTGTGKTASFGLPIVDHVVKKSVEGVQVLVLCPTRELAIQVGGEISRLGKRKETKVLPIYGGAPIERQVQGIEAGAQVIVGTPGRVLDHIRRGTLKTNSVRLLVLDEADEMLSMGFERELTAILESLPASRQTLLFSATVPPDIERISKSKLKNPEFVTLSGDHIGALSIAHFVYMVPADKLGALQRIIEVENPESAVIFCNTKDDTEVVASALQQRGYDADWLNGDLAQNEREKVMSATREGRLRFLVATDVAARGIDISHLTHVINYDFPQDAESYVHRTGRTGRAGRTGTAIALIAPRDIGGLYMLRLIYKIRPIERQIPSAGELKTRAEADLISMFAEAYIPKGTHAEDRALARRLLAHDQAEAVVAGLLRDVLGARANPQEEASSARRAQVRRGSVRGSREERGGRRGSAPAPVAAPPPRVEVPIKAALPASAPVVEAPRPVGPPAVAPLAVAPLAIDPDDAPTPSPRVRFDAAAGQPPAQREAAPEAGRANASEGRGPRRGRADGPSDGGAERERARRPRPERPRQDARGPREGDANPRRAVPVTEFANWQPAAEEGDDEPLLSPRSREAADRSGAPVTRKAPEARENEPSLDAGGDAADYAELFVSVGRRDGIRAQDLLRLLVETAGLDKHTIRRIRVRDRHAFMAVRKADAAAAIAKLHGTELSGRTLTVEIARERTGDLQEGASEG